MEEFIQFLKDSNAFGNFIRNAIKQHPGFDLENFYNDTFCKSELIDNAFTWSNTPEGHDFWR